MISLSIKYASPICDQVYQWFRASRHTKEMVNFALLSLSVKHVLPFWCRCSVCVCVHDSCTRWQVVFELLAYVFVCMILTHADKWSWIISICVCVHDSCTRWQVVFELLAYVFVCMILTHAHKESVLTFECADHWPWWSDDQKLDRGEQALLCEFVFQIHAYIYIYTYIHTYMYIHQTHT